MTEFNNTTINVGNKLFSDSGKVVGWIEGNAFCKRAKASTHMLRYPPAWAWDTSILEKAEETGLDYSIIYDIESQTVYTAKLEYFWTNGIKINRGYGDQIALPISYWSKQSQNETNVAQLGLFDRGSDE